MIKLVEQPTASSEIAMVLGCYEKRFSSDSEEEISVCGRRSSEAGVHEREDARDL